MPRGSNSSIEEQRAAKEMASVRRDGKTGSGPKNFERKGFGSEKGMQTNAKRTAKNDF